MISSEVQRTLVKSPPELWAELSDSSALARHLGELGDIRITHLEPETAVEWEAEDASGTVLLKPSGWGTKVTLTVNRELAEPAPKVAEAESPAAVEPASHEPAAEEPAELISIAHVDPKPVPQAHRAPSLHIEPEPEPTPGGEPMSGMKPEPEPTVGAEHGDSPAVSTEAAVDSEPARQPELRRGFFSRLFRRRETETPVDASLERVVASVEAPPELAASVEYLSEPPWAIATPHAPCEPAKSLEQDSEAHEFAPAINASEGHESATHLESVTHVEPSPHVEPVAHGDSEDEQPTDISAELRAAEEATVEQVTAMLTGVLDRLGAAHHRPFSRS
jgi:hypothetical protein